VPVRYPAPGTVSPLQTLLGNLETGDTFAVDDCRNSSKASLAFTATGAYGAVMARPTIAGC
jgi:hypothetical protein